MNKGFLQQRFAKMAGFWLNLKLILYLQSQCLTENLGFLNPPLLQATRRWQQAEKTEKQTEFRNNLNFF